MSRRAGVSGCQNELDMSLREFYSNLFSVTYWERYRVSKFEFNLASTFSRHASVVVSVPYMWGCQQKAIFFILYNMCYYVSEIVNTT